jgi:4-diphosphocytidyl-2-C-methyl-D-erythritol kinase
MSTAVRSHAKINLGLYIGAPRPDGFHALTTVYQTLEMHDVVTVSACSAAETSIHITSNDSRVPTDNRNTAWKMVSLALEELGLKAKVEIHIGKKLPVQGGLGAGSANAVAALVGLEKELGVGDRALPPFGQRTPEGWGTQALVGLEDELGLTGQRVSRLASEQVSAAAHPNGTRAVNWGSRRLEIAAQVGSDVPLFLIGGTVLGLDRGQEVYPLPDLDPVWCVVAIPAVGVSTAQAFKDWDALCIKENLTPEAGEDKLSELSRAYASAFSGYFPGGGRGAGSSGVLFNEEDLAARPQETKHASGLVRTGITSWIENDFERVVFPQHPSLSEIKRILAASDSPEAALHSSLSGSGSALFGLYQSQGDAEAAAARVKEQASGMEARVTRTLPRAEYWRQMLLE